MKLKTKLMMFTAAMALSSTMAFAAVTSNDILTSYQADAYTFIEVKESPTQIKVEAIKDGIKVEVIYDKETGAVIQRESYNVSGAEASRTGAFVRQVGEDFDDDGIDGIDDDGIDGSDDDSIDGSDDDDNGSDDDDNGSDDDDDH